MAGRARTTAEKIRWVVAKIQCMGKNHLRNPGRYRRVFHEHNGNGPWSCYSCGDEVVQIGRDSRDSRDGNIHHLDDDVTNDMPANLVMMHADCHQRWHGPPTADERQRISAKIKGRPSNTKGMKFPNHWTKEDPNDYLKRKRQPTVKRRTPGVRTNIHGENNPFFGKTHSAEQLVKMRQPRRREICPDCRVEFTLNWFQRHKREGKCIAQST